MSEASNSARSIPRKDYWHYYQFSLPRPVRCKDTERVYPVEVLEATSDSEGTRYKVHYVGYSSKYDEWKSAEEIVDLDEGGESEIHDCHAARPFSLYNKLAHRIKARLVLGRKDSPIVKIDMPFDRVTFDGGLAIKGYKKWYVRGVQRYSIKGFKDLNYLLGMNWHYRGLNKNGDFTYVILETVEFYIHQRSHLLNTCLRNLEVQLKWSKLI